MYRVEKSEIRDGVWYMTVRAEDDRIPKLIEAEIVTGFSIGGYALRRQGWWQRLWNWFLKIGMRIVHWLRKR